MTNLEKIMATKTIKQIIEENKDKEIHLYDICGIWGELPLDENNVQYTPDVVKANDNVINIYIG